jgi:UDP-GlcNAc:undecaprenyl-phosphate/decaprenyl-phosphate GlcNAc-1-phosphate transferase
MPITVAVTLLTACALSLGLVPLIRWVALRAGLMAHPKHDRWHRKPTALLGGVAIAVTLFACVLAGGGLQHQRVLLICVALVFLLGLADDLISLKPSTKLVAQIALASVFLATGHQLSWTGSLTLDSLLTIVWVVGITNAFNLLDNMDGLCAGIAIIIGSFYLMGLMPPTSSLAFNQAQYTAALVGALVGFLFYNFHPASVFMGDSGSLLIGMSFAGLMLDQVPGTVGKSHLLSIVAAPVLILLIPIFDTTLVTVSRMLSGRPASVGGRDHSSHRLVAVGLSERAAVRVLWLLAAVGGVIGLAARRLDGGWAGLATVVFLLAMVIFAVYLAGIRVYDDADVLDMGQGQVTPLAVDFMYKRRVAEVLLDLCLIPTAYYAAYRLRFEGALEFAENFDYFLQSLPLVLGAQMLALFVVGGYRGVWRYFGMMDAVVFGKSVLAGTVSAQLLILYIYGFERYSRTVFIIYALLLVVLLTTSRASFRLIGEFVHRRRQVARRLAIYGAGDGGAWVIKELARGPLTDCKVIGFVDDDPRKARMRVQGYPVLGGYEVLLALIAKRRVDVVVLTTHVMDIVRLRRLEAHCLENGIALFRLNVEVKELVQVSGEFSRSGTSATR